MKYRTKEEAIEAVKNCIGKIIEQGIESIEIKTSDKEIKVLHWSDACFKNEICETQSFKIEPPRPKLKKDQLIWVRGFDTDHWTPRYATGMFASDGKVLCYYNGRTSLTNDGRAPYRWDEYRTTDPAFDKPIPPDPPEKDQLVWVRDSQSWDWVERYATGVMPAEGIISCYGYGKNSTNFESISNWKQYRTTDPALEEG